MTPERIVFFSGGTALRSTSKALAKITSNTVHLVTTFDSGGSTAALRKAFAMPALGDLRNRLLALADPETVNENSIALWNSRLPMDISEADLRRKLFKLADPNDSQWNGIPREEATIFQRCLQNFLKWMPENFESGGASLGNLMLAGTYLEYNRNFDAMLGLFKNLFHTRGVVLPIVTENLNLGARLKNGDIIIGQHLFKSLPAAIDKIFLTVYTSPFIADKVPPECRPEILKEVSDYIISADLVCYPMGSFYSSLVTNLIPRGIGASIATNKGIKVFIPNSGNDPELNGLTLPEQIMTIFQYLRKDSPSARNEDLLNFVLVDKLHGQYAGGLRKDILCQIERLNVRILSRNIVQANNPQKHDPEALVRALREVMEKTQ